MGRDSVKIFPKCKLHLFLIDFQDFKSYLFAYILKKTANLDLDWELNKAFSIFNKQAWNQDFMNVGVLRWLDLRIYIKK